MTRSITSWTETAMPDTIESVLSEIDDLAERYRELRDVLQAPASGGELTIAMMQNAYRAVQARGDMDMIDAMLAGAALRLAALRRGSRS